MEESQEEINEFEAVAMVAEKDPAFEPYVVTDPPCFEDPNNLMMMNDNVNSFPSILLQDNENPNKENEEGKKDTRQNLIEAVERLISYESLNNSISSPMKELCSKMGCDTPLQKLLQSFSPSITKFLNQSEDQQNYSFMQNVNFSPNSLSQQYQAALNPLPNNEMRCMLPENSFGCPEQAAESNASLYPGSMLTGPTPEMISSDQIESYLNGENMSAEAYQNYAQEILNTSEQTWPNMNGLMGGDTMLPPVMLSSYEEMAMLQQEIQANNYMNQYVFPVYFQPVMVPENEKRKNKRKTKSSKQRLPEGNELEENVRNLLALKGDIKDESEKEWLNEIHPTDEELLKRCQDTLRSEEDDKPISSGDSMMYLEQAALKLLKSSENSPSEQLKTKFRCHICLRYFKRLYTLETHIRVHDGSKPFMCQFCGKGFRQSGTKLNHVRAVHLEEKPFVCSYCDKKFSHKSSLVVHERIHTKEKPFQCETCLKRFTDRATYQKHKPIHYDVKPFSCPICSKKFSQKSNLKRHFSNLHKEENPKNYKF